METTEHSASDARGAIDAACSDGNACDQTASAACLPGQGMASPGERFAFLRDELAAGRESIDPDLAQEHGLNLLRLYEYHGGDPSLTNDDRGFARTSYGDAESRALLYECGPEAIETSCGNDLARELDYCARMTGEHIDERLLIGSAPDFVAAEHTSSPALLQPTEQVSHDTIIGFCGDLVRRALDQADKIDACSADVVTTALDIQRRLVERTNELFTDRFEFDRCTDEPSDQVAKLKLMLEVLAPVQRALEDAERYAAGLTDPALEAVFTPEIADDQLAGLLSDFWRKVDTVFGLTGTLEDFLNSPTSVRPCEEQRGLEDVGRSAGLGALFQETVTRSQRVHRSMFRAASESLDGELLVALLGDILGGLLPRLESLSASHDLACRITGDCRASSSTFVLARQTELAYTYRLLSLLDHSSGTSGGAPDLADVLSEGHEASWKDSISTFESSGGQRALIDALLSEIQRIDPSVTQYSPELLEAYSLSEFGAPYRELVSALITARTRTAIYQKSGVFNPDVERTLYTPVDDSRRQDIVSVVASRTENLDSALTGFESDFRTVIAERVASTSKEDDIQRLKKSAQILRERLRRNLERQDTHAVSAAAEPLSDHITGAWINSEGSLENGSVPVPYLQLARFPTDGGVIPISGADAPRSARATDIASLAVPWNGSVARSAVSVASGDILSVQVAPQEQWSPSCILESVEVYPPVAGEPNQRLSAPLTGPSGYLLRTDFQGTSAFVNNSGRSASQSESLQHAICASDNSGAGALGFSSAINRVNRDTRNGICFDQGSRYLESNGISVSRSTETRASASLSGGWHSELTPFDAPVGSLVVVEMPAGETDVRRFRDIHVVTAPSTTLVVRSGGGSDFYLAVNDARSFCEARNAAPNTRPLNVRMVTLTDANAQARATLDAMGAMISFIREHEARLIAEGDILPNELHAIENEARGFLPLALRSESSYPSLLGEAFDALVAVETSRLEHAVKLSVLQDDWSRLAKELNLIADQIDFAERRGEFLSALPRWSVANLQLGFLEEEVIAVNRLMGEFLMPVMEIWYPEVLAELRRAQRTELEALQQVATSESFYLTGKFTQAIADFAVNAIPGASSRSTLQQYRVALSIPRPNDGATCNPLLGCDESSVTSFTANPRTPSAQAAAIWEAIESGQPATFAIEPEDLYRPGGKGVLVCGDVNPVIRNVGLALVPRAQDPSLSQSSILLGAAITLFNTRHQEFAASGGTMSYRLSNERHLLRAIPVVPGNRRHDNSSYASMMTAAWARSPNSQPFGRSPFSTFTFDLTDVVSDAGPITPERIANASELVLYMDMELLEGARGETDYIATCRDP